MPAGPYWTHLPVPVVQLSEVLKLRKASQRSHRPPPKCCWQSQSGREAEQGQSPASTSRSPLVLSAILCGSHWLRAHQTTPSRPRAPASALAPMSSQACQQGPAAPWDRPPVSQLAPMPARCPARLTVARKATPTQSPWQSGHRAVQQSLHPRKAWSSSPGSQSRPDSRTRASG